MISRICILLSLAWIGTIGPAWAFTDLSVRVEPIQPVAGVDFVVVIEGMAETMPVTVENVSRDEQGIEIGLQRPTCLAGTCPLQSFRVDVAIDGSSSPFADGLVELMVTGRAGSVADHETLVWTYFAVGDLFSHSLGPNIILDPWNPTDNERVQVLVPVTANVCGPNIPFLDRIDRQGSLVSVFLRFDPFFGGGFATAPEPATKCTPPLAYLGATSVDLGALEAGTYTLELYLQSTRDESLPLRVNRRDFEVSDAPDVVDLLDGRFTVELEWMDHDGFSGVGKPVPDPSSDSTLFTFFERDNWEVLIKVLDGCAANDRYWVFGAAATDIEYTVTITDNETAAVWTYFNPLGSASAAINDTDAFATCP